MNLSVRLLNTDDLKLVMNYEFVNRLYLDADLYIADKPDLSSFNGEIYFVLPDIFTRKALNFINEHFDFLKSNCDGFMIQNLDELFFLKDKNYDFNKVISSERVYVYNSDTVAFYHEQGLHNFTHPIELTFNEGYKIDFGNVEEIIYGRASLMVSAGCIHKNMSKCDGIKENLILKDRKKMGFFVQNRCDYCYNVTYNSVPTMIVDELDKLHHDAKSVRMDFTFENKEEISNILSLYEACLIGKSPAKELFGDYTRGHYHKGMVS